MPNFEEVRSVERAFFVRAGEGATEARRGSGEITAEGRGEPRSVGVGWDVRA